MRSGFFSCWSAIYLHELHSIRPSGARPPSLLLDEHVPARRDPAQHQLIEIPTPVSLLGRQVRELYPSDVVPAAVERPVAVILDLVAGLEVGVETIAHA